ncbi:sulfotransferase 1C4-like [Penaeus indicus]|uniref:sulfotransferase 1C4-like n=1 Tax=Penaeus indicus TaxID=29960 RepID=UPI00300C052F
MRLASGHVAVQLQDDELKKIQKDFEGFSKGLVRLTPGGWLLPAPYTKFADKIYKTKPYLPCSDMLMEMGRGEQQQASPMLQMLQKVLPDADPNEGIALQLTANIPDPRTIKTHLPFSLMTPDLLDTAKVIYVARNPKDVVLSFLHHSRLIKSIGYIGSLEQYVDYFVKDELIYGPYWEHLREAWPRRDHPNMHFVFYEDMKADPMAELRKLNQFLGTDLTEEQLEKVQRTDIVLCFIICEAGEAGGWKGHLNDMQEAKIDIWTKKNTLKLGIKFKYSA